MKKKYAYYAFVLGVTGFLSACALPQGVQKAERVSLKPAEHQAYVLRAPSERVVQSIEGLVVSDIRTARQPDGRLHFTATLENTMGLRLLLNARVRWLSAHGVLSNPYSEPKVFALEGSQEIAVSFVAPDTAAHDFRLELENVR